MRLFSLSAPRSRRGPAGALSGVLAFALVAACELPNIPDKAPILDLRWVVPTQSTRITVASLLPAGVTVLPDSSGFTVTAQSASVTRTLAQDCAACAAANGFTAPKPAFVGNASMTTSVPADIASATLTSGSLDIVVTNNYTFDPLRPSATARGSAVITVSNGTTVLGSTTIDGAATALPPGGQLTRSIPLSGTITGSQPITVSVSLTSPAGDPVLMDASRTIVVAATPTNLRVASANVAVANRSISASSTINLADIDSTIINRVETGTLLLTVVNPFNATGNLTITLTPAGAAPIVKPVALALGTSTPSITLTKDELRRLLGKSVSVSYTGTVNASGGSVSVSPKQAVVVSTRLDISLVVGG